MILSKENTLIILDWDDTLFPTTWITTNSIDIKEIRENNKLMDYFKQVDNELSSLLKILINLGNVIIVTNAMLNWINLSLTILPLTSKLIRKSNKQTKLIEVISARAKCQEQTSNPMEWKKITFNELIYNAYSDKKINNVISIGDAEYEYTALVELYEHDNKNYKLLKSVKFIKYPTRDVLLDQLKVLQRVVRRICVIKKHLDLKFKTL